MFCSIIEKSSYCITVTLLFSLPPSPKMKQKLDLANWLIVTQEKTNPFLLRQINLKKYEVYWFCLYSSLDPTGLYELNIYQIIWAFL